MRALPLLLFNLLALLVSAGADTVIRQEVESAGGKGEMTVLIKGGKVRSNLAEPVSLIFDSATGDTVYLQHRPRTWHRVTKEQNRAMGEKLRQELSATPGQLEATGQKATLLGYPAEQFRWTIGAFRLNLWVAKSFPGAAALRKLLDGAQTLPLMPATDVLPGLFLRTEMDVSGQKVAYTILSVTEQPVEAAQFEIPSDYKETPFGVALPPAPEAK